MKLKIACCVFALACASSAAFGQMQQDRGWYVGGSVGQAEADRWCQGASGLSCDDNDTAWKIFGGYQINRHFAVEAGYTDLGEVSVRGAAPGINASSNVAANALELVGIGRYPITNRFSVFGKLGFYRGEAEAGSSFSVPGFSISGSEKETNSDVTYGAGLMFDLTRNLALRGEWQRYSDMGGGQVGGQTDVDVMSVGLQVRF
jgi:OmpA-OmpF porin, OOP family